MLMGLGPEAPFPEEPQVDAGRTEAQRQLPLREEFSESDIKQQQLRPAAP